MPSASQVDPTGKKVREINILSSFLSNSQLTSLKPPMTLFNTSPPSLNPTNITPIHISPLTIILAPSAILHQAHVIFSFFQTQSTTLSKPTSSISTLVLTGGIGHSTTHLYTAILKHPVYNTLPYLLARTDNDLTGLPEAQIFHLIFQHYYDGEVVTRKWNQGQGLRVLVEDKSTNCGANAALSKALLEQNGISLGSEGLGTVDDVVVVQDPTMSLRTKASFEKVYLDEVRVGRVRFWTWPTFVPRVKTDGGGEIVWEGGRMDGVDIRGLWDMKRFYGLILGEIPRLRDNEGGYGPQGKGFIVHVDIPEDVENAWRSLTETLEFQR